MVVFSEIPISAMPKLPVAKYCYHGILDYEIGITHYGLVVFAVPYPGITKQLPEEELEFCAFAFVGRHIPVPLLFCQAIHSFLHAGYATRHSKHKSTDFNLKGATAYGQIF